MRAALSVAGLRRRFGSTVALDGLDFTVPTGALCGLVGPNGAGKSTAFGIIAGLVQADAGTVDVLGEGAFDPRRHAGRVSILPQDCALPADLPVGALLTWYGRLQGLGPAAARRAVAQVLDDVALSDRADQRIKQLSHGMRRRVAVAQALLGNPELVLLDEPTSGLDPDLVVRMRSVLQRRAGDATLVVSSHVLAELEATCDHVIFMEAGRAVAQGPMSEITGRAQQVVISLCQPAAPFAAAVEATGLVVGVDGLTLTVQGPAELGSAGINARVLPVLLEAGAGVESVSAGLSLEASWMAARRS
ncbi:MAG: ABC transporter ATP-binding protein [Oligoflexia bacterium]|nr:ABC transporter ATP-binding protein [Oligoflexia bacterium]